MQRHPTWALLGSPPPPASPPASPSPPKPAAPDNFRQHVCCGAAQALLRRRQRAKQQRHKAVVGHQANVYPVHVALHRLQHGGGSVGRWGRITRPAGRTRRRRCRPKRARACCPAGAGRGGWRGRVVGKGTGGRGTASVLSAHLSRWHAAQPPAPSAPRCTTRPAACPTPSHPCLEVHALLGLLCRARQLQADDVLIHRCQDPAQQDSSRHDDA